VSGAPDTRIVRVHGRRVWDSRGRPTVEAEVALACGAGGRAAAPAGASRGSGEAVDRRDGGDRLGGLDVRGAVASVAGEIDAALRGRDAADQEGVDRALIDLDGTPRKSRLGGNATIAVSLACARAAAAARGVPLWRHLRGDGEPVLPLPEIQILGGGVHAAGRVGVQDFMVVAAGARRFAEALEWSAEIYRAAGDLMARAGRARGVADEGGWWPELDSSEHALETLVRAIEIAGFAPGRDVVIALDVAASCLVAGAGYRLDGAMLDTAALVERLGAWLDAYPIRSVEDPLGEGDEAGLAEFTRRFGARVQVVGDDCLVTSARRVERAARAGACNALLVKPNQAGTLTETAAALAAARAAGYDAIVSARSGETEDVAVVHLAVGWGVPQLKVGSFSRSERMAKWNEGLRIEEACAAPLTRFRPGRRGG